MRKGEVLAMARVAKGGSQTEAVGTSILVFTGKVRKPNTTQGHV
jgi:hypothetical protein